MTQSVNSQGQPTPDKSVPPSDKPAPPDSSVGKSGSQRKLRDALGFPWHREQLIIAILASLSLIAVGVAVWRWNVNESHREKIEASKPKKSPYVDGSVDHGGHAKSDRITPYEKTTSEKTLQIPLSILDMERLPLSGNGCVIVLLSISGAPTLIYPLFQEDEVLSQWDYKGSFQFPILATDHCSLSGDWPRVNLAIPSPGPPVPPVPPGAPSTPQQKALTFLANTWSASRYASGKERPSLAQYHANPPTPVAPEEANILFTMLVPISDTLFGVKLRYSSGEAEVAGVWFPTNGVEHIALLGRPFDFEKVFGRDGTIQIPVQVRRTSDAKVEGLTTVATIATRLIVREIQDTAVISPTDKLKSWPEVLYNFFQPDADGPFSQAWRLGPDGCESKQRQPQVQKGFVRVYTKGNSWQYMPVMEKCP
ncbi:hypothetical protein ACVWXM_006252 [Bradyrhizobium sp. GM7.3]